MKTVTRHLETAKTLKQFMSTHIESNITAILYIRGCVHYLIAIEMLMRLLLEFQQTVTAMPIMQRLNMLFRLLGISKQTRINCPRAA